MKTAEEIYRDVHNKYGVTGGQADRYDLEAMETYANEKTKQLKSELQKITEKYSDNSSYYEEHLLKTDEVYKQAVEALKS